MAAKLKELLGELAIANRILAHEDVLDAFGHVSVRHPGNPQRYFLSRSRGPELVAPGDIYEFNLESEPVVPPKLRLYSERVIHGEIYKARPDVHAVCHHHAPAILPYCITGMALVPVYHLGAAMGQRAPFWDSRDEFGDTNLLVVKPEEGASLARALGDHSVVLMRRHGATVVGANLHQLVFRTIYTARNAEYQSAAQAQGTVSPLSPGEVEKAQKLNLDPGPLQRAWEYWATRLAKREGRVVAGPGRRKSATVKVQSKSKTKRQAAKASKGRKR